MAIWASHLAVPGATGLRTSLIPSQKKCIGLHSLLAQPSLSDGGGFWLFTDMLTEPEFPVVPQTWAEGRFYTPISRPAAAVPSCASRDVSTVVLAAFREGVS